MSPRKDAGNIDLSRIERALIVDTPWIDRILDGSKDWEMRSRRTRLRGPIGLIQSRSGTIVGAAEIADSLGPLDPATILNNEPRHHIPPNLVRSGAVAKWNHAWVLQKKHRLATPISYRHPHGAVIWVTLDAVTRKLIASL